MEAKDLVFEETCGCCPEAYKILYEGQEVGYLRLRGGWLSLTAGKYVSVFANDRDETIDVWDYQFENDPYKGSFDDDKERHVFTELAKKKLIEHYEKL